MIFRFVSGIIERIKLKSFDRQAGAMLGFVKGGMLCAIVTLFAVTLATEKQSESIIESRSGYYIAHFLDKANAIIPEDLRESLHDHISKLDRHLGEGQPF